MTSRPGIVLVTVATVLGALLGPVRTGQTLVSSAAAAASVGRSEGTVSFAILGRFKPLSEETFGEGTISVNTARPDAVAWCGDRGVDVQVGESVAVVPTAAALAGIARRLAGRAGKKYVMACLQAMLGTEPGQVFASFTLLPYCESSAPVYIATFGLYSGDNGKAWSFVPVPAGASELSFSSFSYGARGVIEASFSPVPGGALEVTADGGEHWRPVGARPRRCPLTGPCEYFRPVPPSVDCIGFGGTWASLEVSTDSGREWSSPFQVVGYQSYATLVVLGPDKALLVTSGGEEPVAGETAPPSAVMLTTDSGRSWDAISVPSVPRQASGPIIAVLPDGDLLYVGAGLGFSSPGWQLLRRGSRAWCKVRVPAASEVVTSEPTLTVADGKVWWMDGAKVHSTAPDSVVC